MLAQVCPVGIVECVWVAGLDLGQTQRGFLSLIEVVA
jgi:hypothetical protein